MIVFSAERLESLLREAKKIAILAVGNPLRGDDAVGVFVGKAIKDRVPADVYICEMMPENYLFRIASGNYTHAIIVDAADAKTKPGSIFFIEHDEIGDMAISTHAFPLSFTVDFLEGNGIKTIVIGVQPKNTSISEELSEDVENAAKKLSEVLIYVINKVFSKDQTSSRISGSGAHHQKTKK